MLERFEIGFSTGALALGDFRYALKMLEGHGCSVVELSALRDAELPGLMASTFELDLKAYKYISVHAPSKFSTLRESQVANMLLPCIEHGWPVILHPNVIKDHGCWRDFGSLLCLENMDNRKTGRTVEELTPHFNELPDASLCLDLGHARQVDPTLKVALDILSDFGGKRLKQIHLSLVNETSGHEPLDLTMVSAIREISRSIPPVPVVLESVLVNKFGPYPEDQVDFYHQLLDSELEMAVACFSE